MARFTGLLVTPRLIEVVRSMREGGDWQVTTDPRTARRISGSVFARLLKLGWVEWTREWAYGNTYRTRCRLNESGMARAIEFQRLANGEGS